MTRIDWTVIRTAAAAALLLLVPGALASSVIFTDRSNRWTWLFLAVIVCGFTLAGFVAGRLRPDTPMIHGALSGLLAFVVAQFFGLVVVIAKGDSVAWIAIPLTGLIAVSLGVGGALAGDFLRRRLSSGGRRASGRQSLDRSPS